MKRLFFIITILFAAIALHAQYTINVVTNDGRLIRGYLLNGTDSTITIKCTDNLIIKKFGEVLDFKMNCDVREVKLFDPASGRLISKSTPKTWVMPEVIVDNPRASSKPSDPNIVIGKAFKTAGGVSIGIGVPCMIAGTALLVAGNQKIKQSAEILAGKNNISNSDLVNYNEQSINGSGMYTAGCALLPVGAAFTIVGIPLYVSGKKIMNMNFNYTGNGLGVTMQF